LNLAMLEDGGLCVSGSPGPLRREGLSRLPNSEPTGAADYWVWKCLAESPGPGLPTQLEDHRGSAADSRSVPGAARYRCRRDSVLCPGQKLLRPGQTKLSRATARGKPAKVWRPGDDGLAAPVYAKTLFHLAMWFPFCLYNRWPLLDLICRQSKNLEMASKSDLVRAAGYVSTKERCEVSALNFTAFYEALLGPKPQPLVMALAKGRGSWWRSLSYTPKSSSTENLLVGQGLPQPLLRPQAWR